ncbi:MAG: FlgD immunoglobulin-like domain containing protein [Candidatus Eisenbacteria bacterium]
MRSLRKILFLLTVACLYVLGWAMSANAFGGFIENRGQVDSRVKYYCPGSRAAVYFTQGAVVIDLKEEMRNPQGRGPHEMPYEELKAEVADSMVQKGCAIYVRFDGANPSPVIEARGEIETKYNYFLGNDPTRWQTEVPAYGEVVYRDVWPGVDLVFREDAGGGLTYEAVLSLGADAQMVQIRYEGADHVVEEPDGTVLVETPVGSLREERAVVGGSVGIFMFARGNDEPLESVGSTAPEDNHSSLLWSTFLGGGSEDDGYSLVLDASGNPIITGHTFSSDFPTTPGAYDTSHNGAEDVFVAKLAASGSTLFWSTFLGGSSDEYGVSLVLDASGNPVVTGRTVSTDFPTTPGAYDTSFNGSDGEGDVFVAKLSSSGSTLVWSTFLGGSRYDYGWSLALDESDNPVVTGYTGSSDFPTTPGAYDTSFSGYPDVFVAKLSASGSTLLWSTFLGGGSADEGEDRGYSLVLDASGNPIVTGVTWSSDFPTTPGAYDTSFNGDCDAFVTKLSSSGSTLLWSTFLGGRSCEEGYSLVLDASGNPVVSGATLSSDFPTTPGAYGTSYNGGWCDVFVTKLSSSGSTLLWSTFLGGSSYEYGYSPVLDASGNTVVTGYTGSTDFPTTPGAYDTSHNGSYDCFVAKLSASGSTLLWSTFLGGTGGDYGYSLVLDASGDPVVTGGTESSNFPATYRAYDWSWNGDWDVFLAKLLPNRRMVPRLMSEDGGNDVVVSEIETSVAAILPAQTAEFTGLLPSAPDPFSHSMSIRYLLAQETDVVLEVFDFQGRLVAKLCAGRYGAGYHSVTWAGRDEGSRRVAPGIYFIRFRAGDKAENGKVLLLR